jgi:hypothetical protein
MIFVRPVRTASSAGSDDLRGVDEPLVGQHRLDHHLRAVAEGLHDRFRLDKGTRSRCSAPVSLSTDFFSSGDGQALGVDLLDHRLRAS